MRKPRPWDRAAGRDRRLRDRRPRPAGATYKVSFERVDGDPAVEPMVFEDVQDPDELAALVGERGRRHLRSNDIYDQADIDEMAVVVDIDEGTGGFFMPARLFSIEQTKPPDKRRP